MVVHTVSGARGKGRPLGNSRPDGKGLLTSPVLPHAVRARVSGKATAADHAEAARAWLAMNSRTRALDASVEVVPGEFEHTLTCE